VLLKKAPWWGLFQHAPEMAEALDKLIAALAAKQYGYVTLEQLLAIGLGRRAVQYRVSIGQLIRVHAGVYAVGHVNITPVARAFAAVLACGQGAVLSHGSAATLWGYNKRWDMPFEVTVTTARRRPGITVHRSRALTRRDLDRQLGVPVTSPARTTLDITPRLTDRRLARVVNDARHAKLLHLDDLADVLERNPTHPGTGRLRPFVENPTNPSRSPLEDDFITFVKRHGLPMPVTNTYLHGYEIDVLYPAERVIVELDSESYHSSRTSFRGDRRRDAVLLADNYVTVRITEDRLQGEAEEEARRLRAILDERRRTLTVLSNSLAMIPATGTPTSARPAS
jgi:hypothetical protein